MNYAFVHEGKAIGPSGVVKDTEGTPLPVEEAEEYNRAVEREELRQLKEGPERIFCYVKLPDEAEPGRQYLYSTGARLRTWLGSSISERLVVGRRKEFPVPGAGGRSQRRSITAVIFGRLYHGWFFESSGDYARLKRSQKGGGNAVRSDT